MGPFDCVYGVIICGMDSGTQRVDVQLRWGIIKMIMKMDRREQHNAENYDQSHVYRTFNPAACTFSRLLRVMGLVHAAEAAENSPFVQQ